MRSCWACVKATDAATKPCPPSRLILHHKCKLHYNRAYACLNRLLVLSRPENESVIIRIDQVNQELNKMKLPMSPIRSLDDLSQIVRQHSLFFIGAPSVVANFGSANPSSSAGHLLNDIATADNSVSIIRNQSDPELRSILVAPCANDDFDNLVEPTNAEAIANETVMETSVARSLHTNHCEDQVERVIITEEFHIPESHVHPDFQYFPWPNRFWMLAISFSASNLSEYSDRCHREWLEHCGLINHIPSSFPSHSQVDSWYSEKFALCSDKSKIRLWLNRKVTLPSLGITICSNPGHRAFPMLNIRDWLCRLVTNPVLECEIDLYPREPTPSGHLELNETPSWRTVYAAPCGVLKSSDVTLPDIVIWKGDFHFCSKSVALGVEFLCQIIAIVLPSNTRSRLSKPIVEVNAYKHRFNTATGQYFLLKKVRKFQCVMTDICCQPVTQICYDLLPDDERDEARVLSRNHWKSAAVEAVDGQESAIPVFFIGIGAGGDDVNFNRSKANFGNSIYITCTSFAKRFRDQGNWDLFGLCEHNPLTYLWLQLLRQVNECRKRPVITPIVSLGRRVALVPFLFTGVGDNPASLSMCGMTAGRRCRFAWDYGRAEAPTMIPNFDKDPNGLRTLEQAVAVAEWAKTASESDKRSLQKTSGYALTSPYFVQLIGEYAEMNVNPFELFGPELLHTWSLGLCKNILKITTTKLSLMRPQLIQIVELSLDDCSWNDLPAKVTGRALLDHSSSLVGKEIRASILILPLVLRSLRYEDGAAGLDLEIMETIAEVSQGDYRTLTDAYSQMMLLVYRRPFSSPELFKKMSGDLQTLCQKRGYDFLRHVKGHTVLAHLCPLAEVRGCPSHWSSEFLESTHVSDRTFISKTNRHNVSRDTLIHHQIRAIDRHIRQGGWWPADTEDLQSPYLIAGQQAITSPESALRTLNTRQSVRKFFKCYLEDLQPSMFSPSVPQELIEIVLDRAACSLLFKRLNIGKSNIKTGDFLSRLPDPCAEGNQLVQVVAIFSAGSTQAVVRSALNVAVYENYYFTCSTTSMLYVCELQGFQFKRHIRHFCGANSNWDCNIDDIGGKINHSFQSNRCYIGHRKIMFELFN